MEVSPACCSAGIMCGSPYPAKYKSSGSGDPEKYLYIPKPMKVSGDSEILALQSSGPFPRREEYKTSVAALL